jgi:hypothetical protein
MSPDEKIAIGLGFLVKGGWNLSEAEYGTVYALLYNGILGDKHLDGGNVLTHIPLNRIMYNIDAAAEKKG